jgi:prepilin-type N-terminal cleavage/methylation domain-containing protein
MQAGARSGFTLIEVLIVLAIGVAISVVALVSTRGFQRVRQIEIERDKLVTALQDARARSIAQEDGLQWNIYLENGAADFYTLFSGTNYETGTSTGTLYLPLGIGFVAPTATTTISFSLRTGTTTAAIVTIARSDDPTASATITVAENGVINY